MAGKPKASFYFALGIVVIGLVAFAVYRSDLFAPAPPEAGRGPGGGPQEIEPAALGQAAEADDAASVTTVSEYQFVPR